jgi:hypothetical protein
VQAAALVQVAAAPSRRRTGALTVITSVALPIPDNPVPNRPISLKDRLSTAAHDGLRQYGVDHVNPEKMACSGLA